MTAIIIFIVAITGHIVALIRFTMKTIEGLI